MHLYQRFFFCNKIERQLSKEESISYEMKYKKKERKKDDR